MFGGGVPLAEAAVAGGEAGGGAEVCRRRWRRWAAVKLSDVRRCGVSEARSSPVTPLRYAGEDRELSMRPVIAGAAEHLTVPPLIVAVPPTASLSFWPAPLIFTDECGACREARIPRDVEGRERREHAGRNRAARLHCHGLRGARCRRRCHRPPSRPNSQGSR